jgi:hypothetical protein
MNEQNPDRHIGCPAYPNCDLDPLNCYRSGMTDTDCAGYREESDEGA